TASWDRTARSPAITGACRASAPSSAGKPAFRAAADPCPCASKRDGLDALAVVPDAIDHGLAGPELALEDLLGRELLDRHHHGAQRVAVGGDEYRPARLEVR